MEPTHFEIQIASPPDREKLVAMVMIANEQWAELSQEFENLVLEIYPRQDGTAWVLDFEATMQILQQARVRLTGK